MGLKKKLMILAQIAPMSRIKSYVYIYIYIYVYTYIYIYTFLSWTRLRKVYIGLYGKLIHVGRMLQDPECPI
jgi:hypothetical protein